MYYDTLIGDVPSKENLMLRIYVRMLRHNYKIIRCIKNPRDNSYDIQMSGEDKDWMSSFHLYVK